MWDILCALSLLTDGALLNVFFYPCERGVYFVANFGFMSLISLGQEFA